eukprot:4237634-Amphidinium_carterae.1
MIVAGRSASEPCVAKKNTKSCEKMYTLKRRIQGVRSSDSALCNRHAWTMVKGDQPHWYCTISHHVVSKAQSARTRTLLFCDALVPIMNDAAHC